MERQRGSRWIGLVLAILVGLVLIRFGLFFVSPAGLPVTRVIATRFTAAAYLLCDVAISSSLITLLVISDRRPPAWLEHRLPFAGRWLWHFLLGLTILSYLSLAPTFLFFLVQMERWRR